MPDSSMTITEILEVLPHRFPMLLVDRILEVIPGKSCIGLKNVTINEAFFEGHYPGNPIMPGVLIIEAMAQAGSVILLADPKFKGRVPIIGAIDNVKLKKPVTPGDALISEVELLWLKGSVGRLRAQATVDGQLCASMELTFMMVSKGA